MERHGTIFDLKPICEALRRERAIIADPFELYVDSKCVKELAELLKEAVWRKRFVKVLSSMMTNRRGRQDLYGHRQEFDLWVMKISTKLNSRLICKEFGNGRIVVIAHVQRHKTTYPAVTKKTKGMYESVKSYTYPNIEP